MKNVMMEMLIKTKMMKMLIMIVTMTKKKKITTKDMGVFMGFPGSNPPKNPFL